MIFNLLNFNMFKKKVVGIYWWELGFWVCFGINPYLFWKAALV
jgi:hypothetical protein